MKEAARGYQILYADTAAELSSLVNAMIREGWEPQGGVAVLYQPTGPVFPKKRALLQAIIYTATA